LLRGALMKRGKEESQEDSWRLRERGFRRKWFRGKGEHLKKEKKCANWETEGGNPSGAGADGEKRVDSSHGGLGGLTPRERIEGQL